MYSGADKTQRALGVVVYFRLLIDLQTRVTLYHVTSRPRVWRSPPCTDSGCRAAGGFKGGVSLDSSPSSPLLGPLFQINHSDLFRRREVRVSAWTRQPPPITHLFPIGEIG